MKKKRRIIRKAAAIAAVLGLFTGQVFAASLVETASATYFQRAYGDGTRWEDREEKEYRVADAQGAVVYCLESGKAFSQDAYSDRLGLAAANEFLSSDYVQANLNVSPEVFLKGLLYLASYGYPNYVPENLTAGQARYATSAAVHTYVAKSVKNAVNEAGRGKFGYSVYAHLEPGNTSTDKWLRAKPGVEGAPETFAWFQELYRGALEGKQMPHSLQLDKSSLVLSESGDSFTGSFKVLLENMNYGYRIDSASESAVRSAGGSIAGYTGKSGDTLVVSIPKKGNTNRSFTVRLVAKDNRSLENMAFWVPENTAANQTLAGIYAAGSSGSFEAAGNLSLEASAVLKTPNYGLELTVRKESSDSIVKGHPLYSLKGAKFEVLGTDAAGNAVREEVVTGDDGTARTVKKFGAGTLVTVREILAPAGFAACTEAGTLTVSEESSSNVIVMKDDPLLASADIKIAKVDSRGENAAITQNPAVFKAEYFAGYDWSGSPARTWYFATGADGMLSLSDESLLIKSGKYSSAELYRDASGAVKLPLGSLRLTEEAAPEGYSITSAVMKGKITPAGSSAVFSWESGTQSALAEHIAGGVGRTDALVVGNAARLYGVQGVKLDSKRGARPSGDASLAGGEISVINRSEFPVTVGGAVFEPGAVCAVMTTAADGSFQLPAKLPCGSYELKETRAPEGYIIDSDWSWAFRCSPGDPDRTVFTVPEGSEPVNDPLPQKLKIRKWDKGRKEGVSGEVSPRQALEGIRFEVVNISQNPVVFEGSEIAPGEIVAVVSTSYDAQNGEYSAVLEGLSYGSYGVRELESPEHGSGMANAWYMVDDASQHAAVLHNSEGAGDAFSALDFSDTRLCSLTVSKTVAGNMGSTERKFDFELALSGGSGKPVRYALAEASGSVSRGEAVFTDGKFGFSLSHGESITFEGIESGSTYELCETGAEEAGYTVQWQEGSSGTIDGDVSVSVVNTRESVVPTGLGDGSGRAEFAASSALLGTVMLVRAVKESGYGGKKGKEQ